LLLDMRVQHRSRIDDAMMMQAQNRPIHRPALADRGGNSNFFGCILLHDDSPSAHSKPPEKSRSDVS
jgi:hypothetical protein